MDIGDYILRLQDDKGKQVTLWYITLKDARKFIRERPGMSMLFVYDEHGEQHIIPEATA